LGTGQLADSVLFQMKSSPCGRNVTPALAGTPSLFYSESVVGELGEKNKERETREKKFISGQRSRKGADHQREKNIASGLSL